MIQRIIAIIIANTAAFLGSAYLLPGFILKIDNIPAFAALIVIFSAIQLLIRPIIKAVLSPLILVTFGLFNLVITGGILFIVDKYSENININGLSTLIYATLIITIANIILNTSGRIFRR